MNDFVSMLVCIDKIPIVFALKYFFCNIVEILQVKQAYSDPLQLPIL